MDRQAAADFWCGGRRRRNRPIRASMAADSRAAGHELLLGQRGQRDLPLPQSSTTRRLNNSCAASRPSFRTDAETASLCSYYLTGGIQGRLAACGDMSHDATKAWYGAGRPLQNAPQRAATRRRAGISHARRKGLAVAMWRRRVPPTMCAATPELSRLLDAANSLLHIRRGGWCKTVDTLPQRRGAGFKKCGWRDAARRRTWPLLNGRRRAALVSARKKAAAPKPVKGARGRRTDAWFAVRDAPDEEARAVLAECLGMDGDLGMATRRSGAAGVIGGDKRNMKLMQDRATATTRARHCRAPRQKVEEPDRDAIQLKAALKLQRAYRARHCPKMTPRRLKGPGPTGRRRRGRARR